MKKIVDLFGVHPDRNRFSLVNSEKIINESSQATIRSLPLHRRVNRSFILHTYLSFFFSHPFPDVYHYILIYPKSIPMKSSLLKISEWKIIVKYDFKRNVIGFFRRIFAVFSQRIWSREDVCDSI